MKRFNAASSAALIALYSIFALPIQFLALPTPQAYAAAVPGCSYINVSAPANPLVGETISYGIEMENTGADPGFRPILETVLPPELTYSNPSTFSVGGLTIAPTTNITVTDNDGGDITTGDVVNGVTGETLEDLLVDSTYLVFELPLGSFASDQPAVSLTVDATVSSLVTPGVSLTDEISSQCSFAFGEDALNNPGSDPILKSGFLNLDVVPTIFTVAKSVVNTNGDEDEVSTGPNFPFDYSLSADVANGETVTSLTLSETIPDEIQLTEITTGIDDGNGCSITFTPSSGPVENTTCAALPYNIVASVPGGTLSVVYTSINGAVGGGDASVDFEVFIPDLDAGSADVLDPAVGSPNIIPNTLSGTGTHSSGPVADSIDSDIDVSGESMTIQKSVSISSDTGPVGFSPGDTLEYTLNFQISDYFSFDELVIEDILSDGQTFVSTSAEMSVSEGGVTTNNIAFTESAVAEGALIAGPPYDFAGGCGGCELAITIDSTDDGDGVDPPADGETYLLFDVSGAMVNEGLADGELVGNAGGSGTTGTLTFEATIDESYVDAQANDTSVDALDELTNNVNMTGRITSDPANNYVTDSSSAGATIVGPTFDKDIIAYDDGTLGAPFTVIPDPLQISPSHEVVFVLDIDVPSGDMEDLIIKDFLPIPFFDAATFTSGGGCGFDAATLITPYTPADGDSASIPGPCEIGFGSGTTGFPGGLPTPVISNDGDINGGNNALVIDFTDDVTFEETPSDGIHVQLLFNALVEDEPFDDSLKITNFAQYQVDNSNVTNAFNEPVIIDIETSVPGLNITKGAIATDKAGATFTPATVGPGAITFNAPASSPSLTFTEFSSTELAAESIESTLEEVDSADLVTFALVIENTGSQDAFDLSFDDTLPSGFVVPGGGINLQIYEGDGTTLANPADYTGGLFGDGGAFITMDAGYDLDGLNSDTEEGGGSEGQNILIITYDLEVNTGVEPLEVITNDASILSFSAIPAGTNFVTGQEALFETSTDVTIADLVHDKVVFATDQTHTPGSAVVPGEGVTIGEVVTYSIPITLPEGTTTNLELDDNIPGRIAYFIDNGVTVTGAANCGGAGVPATAFDGTLPVATVTTPVGAGFAGSGADINITFTDAIVNNDNDETDNTFCVQYDVGISDAGGNVTGTNRQNNASLTYTAAAHTTGTERARVDILEPDLEVTKEVLTLANAVPAGIDANDILKYRITVDHSGDSDIDAFDLELTDDLTGLKITLDDSFSSDGLDNDGDGLIDGADGDELDGVAAPFWDGTEFTWNNSTTNGSDYDQLALADDFTIEFGFTVNTDVLPNETITNTVDFEYDGIPGTPAAPLFERTYNDSSDGDLTIEDVAIDKTLFGTSEGFTGDTEHTALEDLAIGEEVTFQIEVTFPESEVTNLQLQDVFPDFIRVDSINVTSDGAGTAGMRTESILDNNNGDAIDDTALVTYATYGYDNSTNGVDTTTLQFQVTGTVLDEVGNEDADQLTNDATVSYDNLPGGTQSDSVSIELVEPDLDLTKGIDDNTGDAGDTRTYSLTIDHNANSTADAFDLVVDDVLPAGVTALGDFSSDGLDNDGDGLIDGADGDEVDGDAAPFYTLASDRFDWTFDSLMQGNSITIEFEVTIDNTVSPNQVITNTGNIAWDSLPADADPDERSYNDSGLVQLTVDNIDLVKTVFSTSFTETGTAQVNGALEDLAIGEEVRYRLSVEIPEGATTDFEISDVQGAGLEIQSGSLISDDGIVADNDPPTITISDDNGGDGIDDTILFEFGNLTNAPDGDTETITVEVVSLVIDDVANTPTSNPFGNTAEAYINSVMIDDETAEVEVVEPSLTLDKVVNPLTGDSGDTAEYTITVENTGTAPAFDLEITDVVPANLTVTTPFDGDSLDNNGDSVDDDANETLGNFFDNTDTFTWNSTTTGNALFDQLDPGSSFTLEYEVTLGVGVSPADTLVNDVDLVYDSAPGVNANERDYAEADDATITVPFGANLIKELRDANTEKTIGDTIPYRIIFDVPEGTVNDLVVTDDLPAGLAFIPGTLSITDNNNVAISYTGTPTNPGLTPASTAMGTGDTQEIVFDFDEVTNTDVDNGTTEQITIEYDVVALNTSDNNATDVKVNSVEADYDGSMVGPLGAPPITIVEPDLQIDKTSTYTTGDTITYFIAVSHNAAGQPNAHDVVVSDSLPANVTYDGNINSINGPAPVVDDSAFPVITFSFDEIDAAFTGGNPVNFSFDVEVDLALASGTLLTNDADLEYTGQDGAIADVIPGNTLSNERTGDDTDPGGAQNDYERTDSLDVTVTRPDLSTSTKTVTDLNGGDLEIGDTLEYTITVINTGNTAATGVRVTDDVPEFLENFNVTATPAGSADASLPAPNGANSTGFLDITTISLDASGGGNDTRVITFEADVSPALPDGTSIENTVTCEPASQGGQGCTDDADIGVSAPILNLSKTASPNTNLQQEDQVTYTIEIENTGNAPSTNLTLIDPIPGNMSYVNSSLELDLVDLTDAADLDEGDYNISNPGAITIVLPSLAAGNSASINFNAQVLADQNGSITNTVSATDDQGLDETADVPVTTITSDGGGSGGGGGGGGSYRPEVFQQLFGDEQTNQRDDEVVTCEVEPLPSLNTEACLQLDSERNLSFGDLLEDDPANPFIETLKNTQIIDTGDYVFSGTGNHSTGNQQGRFESGQWEFQSEREATRLEAVKTVLVSNCIAVEETIPVPSDGFRFTDVSTDVDPSDEVNHFISRVFYTAYKHGVATGYEDGSARPLSVATASETMALGLRAADAIPKDYQSTEEAWYSIYMDFARLNGIMNGLELQPEDVLKRNDFAQILTRTMAYNPDPRIHGYISRIDMQNQSFLSDLEASEPIPDLSEFDYDESVCLAETACLQHIPDRPLSFTDVPEDHWAFEEIEALRTTQIIADGDYVVSGNGNHSTGKQQSEYQSGSWEYQEGRALTTMEAVKIALVSSCIPIPDTVPIPENGFEFRDLPLTGVNGNQDDLDDFVYRLFYTAYENGVYGGVREQFSHALKDVSRDKAITIFSRAALGTSHVDQLESTFQQRVSPSLLKEVESAQSGQSSNRLFKADRLIQRSEAADLLVDFMLNHRDEGIRRYTHEVMDFYE